MYKKYTAGFLAAVLALLALCAAIVLVLDPAFQYHMPLPGVEAVYSNERYQNAGLIKNSDYDTIVIGSSTVSNTRASWYDELFGGKTLKVCYPGGTFGDFDIALDTAFATHDIKRVFVSLDPRLLSADPVNSHEMPLYLYDFNPLNDVQYLFNKDILLELCGSSLLATVQGNHTDLDDAFVWEDGHVFSLEKAIASYSRPAKLDVVRDRYYYDDAKRAHYAILDSWITEHPDTEFYFYFPPYSTLYLDSIIRTGEVEPMIFLLFDTANRYMNQPNVKFYSFMEQNAITTDFSNYTDMVHFRSEINYYIAEYMATHEPMQTEDDAYYMVNVLRSLVAHYDFESLFPESAQEQFAAQDEEAARLAELNE